MNVLKPTTLLFAAVLVLQPLYSRHKPDVIAYYTGDGRSVENYPLSKLSHIIFSFLHLDGDTLAFSNDTQRENLRQLSALKDRFPHLKIMVSLGGWGGCATCSPVFASDSSRKHFAASVVRILKDYRVDGIDLDWEYPVIEGYPDHPFSAGDKENFTALLRELRHLMGRHYELSFAAGGFTKYLTDAVDWKAVIKTVDRVNLMTYDLVSGNSTLTGHHTALFGRAEQTESTDNCVQYLIQHGISPSKLVIGAAFYARVWGNIDSINKGLYKRGNFSHGVDFRDFNTKLSADSGWMHYWDDVAHAPYSYNPLLKQFATYDNERSIAEKVAYVRRHKLGGIMFWELKSDAFTKGLVDAISNSLQ